MKTPDKAKPACEDLSAESFRLPPSVHPPGPRESKLWKSLENGRSASDLFEDDHFFNRGKVVCAENIEVDAA